jgi:hypothetical protein
MSGRWIAAVVGAAGPTWVEDGSTGNDIEKNRDRPENQEKNEVAHRHRPPPPEFGRHAWWQIVTKPGAPGNTLEDSAWTAESARHFEHAPCPPKCSALPLSF